MLIVPIGTCYYVVWCDNFYAQIPRSPAVLISFAATLILLLINVQRFAVNIRIGIHIKTNFYVQKN